MDTIKQDMRAFVVEHFLLGQDNGLADDTSFLEQGIVDSTGVLEIVAHLQERCGIKVEDDELVPENLDSIAAIAAYVKRKQGTAGGTAGGR